MQNKKGFTLSEVMVTLVLVGILAAILIPQIMDMKPSAEKIMFKKAYFNLETGVSELINNLTAYPVSLTPDETSTQVEQGFNNTNIITSGLGAMNIPSGVVNKFCYLLAQQLDVAGSATCSNATGINTFTTTDGILWTIYTPGTAFPVNSGDYSTTITFDVNGLNSDGSAKAPNCSTVQLNTPNVPSTIKACTGTTIPDTYQIGVRYDGNLYINPADTNAVSILAFPTDNKINTGS